MAKIFQPFHEMAGNLLKPFHEMAETQKYTRITYFEHITCVH